ncbi:MAG: DivIVA domain-containing protein, partial [Eubacterium sp.]
MSNDFDRNQILGAAARDFGFDKVLRGYDTKQVDEYIKNLLETNKTASELFDTRFNDLKKEN